MKVKKELSYKREYITGTGQRLVNVHPIDECQDRPCVIHNPSDHVMQHFPTYWRADRRMMERLCPTCGCGHPDPDSPWPKGSAEWIHGCCGACFGSCSSLITESNSNGRR